MLASEEGVTEDIQQLETHYLANPDGEAYFTLLSGLEPMRGRNTCRRGFAPAGKGAQGDFWPQLE